MDEAMSDNDPRLEVLLPVFDHRPGFTKTVLGSLDAADRAAGIVRGDTNDEALVGLVARTWFERQSPAWWMWDEASIDCRDGYLGDVRDVLAAIRESTQ